MVLHLTGEGGDVGHLAIRILPKENSFPSAGVAKGVGEGWREGLGGLLPLVILVEHLDVHPTPGDHSPIEFTSRGSHLRCR